METSQEYEETLKKLLEEEKANKKIDYLINYDDVLRTSFMKTYGNEGLEFINLECLKKHRGVMTYLIKNFGANLLSGKSIMNVSLPINIFDPRSALEL